MMEVIRMIQDLRLGILTENGALMPIGLPIILKFT